MGLMELPFFEPDNDCRPYTGESLPRIHLVSSVIPKDLAEFQRNQLWWAGRKMSQRSKAVCYVPGHEFVVDYEITIIDHTKLDLEEERKDRIADVILMLNILCSCGVNFSCRRTCGGVMLADIRTFFLDIRRLFAKTGTAMIVGPIIFPREFREDGSCPVAVMLEFFTEHFGLRVNRETTDARKMREAVNGENFRIFAIFVSFYSL